ncbi:hypothetical protein FGO68_gene3044 [Halteria grandinella]|uniref:Uncharacterized protein n=1 Tax=Halteria grandinella TaxID=5974 RepID=A0A8J8NZG1_HALGN|nr:hypothetical protein FGO68_gene3044 [Halteria grandinella]
MMFLLFNNTLFYHHYYQIYIIQILISNQTNLSFCFSLCLGVGADGKLCVPMRNLLPTRKMRGPQAGCQELAPRSPLYIPHRC